MSSVDYSRGRTPPTAATPAPVRMVEIEGRGRAMVASKALRPGEIVLRDSPILLYSALPLKPLPPPPQQQQQQPQLQQQQGGDRRHYCSNCFRILDPASPSVVSCPSCSTAAGGGENALVLFCSPTCRSTALSLSHTPWACQALSRLRDCPSSLQLEIQVQARFLVAAYNLAVVSPSVFRTLLCLQGETPTQPDAASHFLHSLISSLCPPPLPHSSAEFNFSVELTAALLAKDKLNAFGLMEPFAEDGERSVRAYGIYPIASFFNHDCLPNACRFDYVDASADFNTDIVVRMIHDVPEGREICLSYFPVNLNYSDRQQRLKEDYGFCCTCDRCKVEEEWTDEDDDDDGDVGYNGEEEVMDEDQDELMEDLEPLESGVKEENNFPHAYFFMRYMCNRKNCWGTLAPFPPSNGTPSTVMECNVCGNLKNADEAMDGDALEE